jgi:hypothetical protein
MNVPDDVRKCVLFLGIKKEGKFVPKGTGFIVSRDELGVKVHFLVTVRHVVGGLLAKGHEIWMRENLKDGTCLESALAPNVWHYHPNIPSGSDVVAACIAGGSESDAHSIPISGFGGDIASREFMSSMNLGIGDEIAIVGLFRGHYGADRNVPIVRIGNIAALQEPVKTRYFGYIDAHLIEARSIGGLSGSPVFLFLPPVKLTKQESGVPGLHQRNTTFADGQGMFLLGLVHGHFDVDDIHVDTVSEDGGTNGAINTGIAIVVPVEKVLETIDEPDWVAERKKEILQQLGSR